MRHSTDSGADCWGGEATVFWTVLALALAGSGSSMPASILPPSFSAPLPKEAPPDDEINLFSASFLQKESSAIRIDLATGKVDVRTEYPQGPRGSFAEKKRSGAIPVSQLTLLRHLAEAVRQSGLTSETCKQAEVLARSAGRPYQRPRIYDAEKDFRMRYSGQSYGCPLDGCESPQIRSLVHTAYYLAGLAAGDR